MSDHYVYTTLSLYAAVFYITSCLSTKQEGDTKSKEDNIPNFLHQLPSETQQDVLSSAFPSDLAQMAFLPRIKVSNNDDMISFKINFKHTVSSLFVHRL